jgi:hypothetical protein
MQLSENRIANVVGRNVVSGTVVCGFDQATDYKICISLIIYLFIYGEQNKGLRTRATRTNTLSGIFIVLANSKMSSPRVSISLYPDTLS